MHHFFVWRATSECRGIKVCFGEAWYTSNKIGRVGVGVGVRVGAAIIPSLCVRACACKLWTTRTRDAPDSLLSLRTLGANATGDALVAICTSCAIHAVHAVSTSRASVSLWSLETLVTVGSVVSWRTDVTCCRATQRKRSQCQRGCGAKQSHRCTE
jgi:hypothetical protein